MAATNISSTRMQNLPSRSSSARVGMKIEKAKISALKLNPANPRTIKDEKFAQLVRSVRDFPQMLEIRPIVVNAKMEVLGGNMRLRACIEAGLKEVPIIRAENLTDDQQREFIIKDNVGFGEWDWEALSNEWDAEELADWGLDVPDFAAGGSGEVQEDDYEVPEEIETDIVAGDLFEIGPHRLLCGDSTKAEDVARLLGEKEPYLMVTDPPYGVEYDPTWRDRVDKKGLLGNIKTKNSGLVSNDDRADWTDAWRLCPSSVVYVWHGAKHSPIVFASLESCGFAIRSQIIWNKPQGVFGRGDYHWKHEPCWYAVKKGNAGNWAGDRKQTTVWDISGMSPFGKSRDDSDNRVGHGTQKPVECMARPIRNHDGDVYDPFLGSGTTMVAAHQLNRKCYGMEIDPKYCQVIVDRMLRLDPDLQIKKNGQPYKIREISGDGQ